MRKEGKSGPQNVGPSGAVQTVSSKRAVGHYFWYFSFLVGVVVVTTVAKMA